MGGERGRKGGVWRVSEWGQWAGLGVGLYHHVITSNSRGRGLCGCLWSNVT